MFSAARPKSSQPVNKPRPLLDKKSQEKSRLLIFFVTSSDGVDYFSITISSGSPLPGSGLKIFTIVSVGGRLNPLVVHTKR